MKGFVMDWKDWKTFDFLTNDAITYYEKQKTMWDNGKFHYTITFLLQPMDIPYLSLEVLKIY